MAALMQGISGIIREYLSRIAVGFSKKGDQKEDDCAIRETSKRIRFQSNDHRPSVHGISTVRKPLSTAEEWSSGSRPARAGNLFILLFLAI